MLPPPLPPSTADEIIDAVVAMQFYGYDALLPLPPLADDDPAAAADEWRAACDGACAALLARLETYARNQKNPTHAALAEAWFADADLRAQLRAVIDETLPFTSGGTSMAQLQHRINIVLAELSERLMRYFCIATDQIRRPLAV